jgi:histidinol dehydrogenase
MDTINYPLRNEWSKLLQRPAIDTASLEQTVNEVLLEVQKNGDSAIKKFTLKFDKVQVNQLLVNEGEFEEAEKTCGPELKAAIQLAKNNIKKFHNSQKEEIKYIETVSGVKCWRRSVGIEKVGLYIPGGSAPLFSTILMLGVPATLAGCKEIILCSPPNSEGKLNPAILYAAKLVGITKVFKVGGVQAIAAMAFGTESVPKVYKIFGPGNQYVTCAKQLVNKNGTAIDMPAGPSELAVVAAETCVPAFVAADLLSQAEHGEDSQVILISTSEKIISEIKTEVYKQLDLLPRKIIAAKALENSKAFLVNSINEAIDLINDYAPEHLIIACKNDEELAIKIINAGSIFLGNYSCESAGDYASGTNHALPTNGYAKAYSGVSLDSFVKKITIQKITQQGINNIGVAIELMAEVEGLQAHKNAVTIRLTK